ncbi:hypothetical protein D3C71_1782710 [compost metagenome]
MTPVPAAAVKNTKNVAVHSETSIPYTSSSYSLNEIYKSKRHLTGVFLDLTIMEAKLSAQG